MASYFLGRVPNPPTGVLLFLFIPLVLARYLRLPLGLPGSVVLGAAFMFAHRFVARPFMDRHLLRRCFWCGSDLSAPGVPAPFRSRGETIEARACSGTHADRLITFARIVAAARLVVFLLILLPVLIYLGNAFFTIAGHGFLPQDTARARDRCPRAQPFVARRLFYALGLPDRGADLARPSRLERIAARLAKP